MLAERGQSSSILRTLWFRAAAAILVLIVGYFSWTLVEGNKSSQIEQMVYNQYTFPQLSLSRSGEINLIDAQLQQIRSGNYQEALDALQGEDLSEKDLFYKCHLLYATKQFTAAEELITRTPWQDEYYRNEIKWLEFLLGVQSKENRTALQEKILALPENHQADAERILSEIR